VLAELQLPLVVPLGELGRRLVVVVPVVERVEAFHARPLAHEVADVVERTRGRVDVVGRDVAAQHHARVHRDAAQHGVEQPATDVVEEDVDTVRRELTEPGRDVFGLVVDARVEAELIDHPCALGRRARDAEHTRALHLGDLARDRAHPARGGRDEERLARLGARDLEHADVRSDADVAEHAEHVGEHDAFGQHRDRWERVRLDDAVLLPAGEVHEGAAERILVGIVGLHDDAHAVRPHALADRDARHVVAALVEPAPDRRIDAEVPHLEQGFALAELGHVAHRRLEARFGHRARRAAREHDLVVAPRAQDR